MDVLTGKPNYPDGDVFPGYHAGGCSTEEYCGATVYRVPIFPRGRKSALSLALNYLSFILSGGGFGLWQLRKSKPDIVFVYAPSPLLQVLPALLIGKFKGAPVVVYVQDLWPESIEATGYVRNRWVLRIVESVVRFIYQHADMIMVSSRPFERAIQRFSPSAKVVYYPNSVNLSFCNPNAGLKPEVPALNEGFAVVFAGNVGSAQAVQVIVEAARLLKLQSSIRLVVLGAGSELEWMRQQKENLELENLYLAGRFPVEAMPWLLSRAAVLLATLADQPIFAATVPNKIQAYMAAGRPIIACMNGEGARLVTEAKAGIAVPAERAHELAKAILVLYKLPQEERERMGENGQAYYRNNFDHENLISQLLERLESLVDSKK